MDQKNQQNQQNQQQNPEFVFGQTDQDQPNSKSLNNFIFNFLINPFNSLKSKLSSSNQINQLNQNQINQTNQNQINQNNSTNSTLSKFFAQKGNQPLSDLETKNVLDLLQKSQPKNPSSNQSNSINSIHSINHQNQNSQLTPTIFTPHFPSLSNSTQFNQTSNHNSFKHSSTSSKLKESNLKRKMIYFGPGHSNMNHSNQLNLSRQKNLIINSNLIPSNLSISSTSQSHSKRRKISNSSNLSILDHSTQSINQNISSFKSPTIKNHHPLNFNSKSFINPTPIRPSPLRSVTLPSPSPSPSKQSNSTSQNFQSIHSSIKKSKRKHTSSIISSVIKQVDLEIQTRTPNQTPIKSSQVVNPYCLERSTRQKPNPESIKTLNHHQLETRKRKIEACLNGSNSNQINSIDLNSKPQSNNIQIQQILQKTIPHEYQSETKKKKTRQVGKLPERLLKKQQAQRITRSVTAAQNQDTSNSSQTKNSLISSDLHSNISSNSSSSSHNNLASPSETLESHQIVNSTSSSNNSGAKDSSLNHSNIILSNPSQPISSLNSHQSILDNDNQVSPSQKTETEINLISPRVLPNETERQSVISQVKKMKIDELKLYTDLLLIDNQKVDDELEEGEEREESIENLDLEIKQVVKGFNLNELPKFLVL